jgi:hypothetical protein
MAIFLYASFITDDNLLRESSVRNRLLETEQFKLSRPAKSWLA